jgi:hypothetical protein
VGLPAKYEPQLKAKVISDKRSPVASPTFVQEQQAWSRNARTRICLKKFFYLRRKPFEQPDT